MVGLMVRDGRFTTGVADLWQPRPGCLTIVDREEILVGIRAGDSLTVIAQELGRAPSTVSREVAANGGRDGYSAWAAHQRARRQSRRPKPCKLRSGPLRDEVARRLQQLWSPDEISRRLPLDFPDDPEMRVSHETIYQSLFVQGRGELRRELARCLRTGRTCRKQRGTPDGRGRIPGMVMISERPPEVDDRAVPGHWEGELILGTNGRSAVGTLVERSTRLVLLLHLEGGRAAVSVEAAMRTAIATLPDAPVDHMGPRRGDVRSRQLHDRHRHPDLLLRSTLALAARFKREHQRTPTPIPAERDRPVGLQRC
jgi:IS30 family transposase